MAAATFLSKENQNLETYCLIWLDSSANNSQENIQAQQQLRLLINHLLTFENDQQCLEYIHSLTKDDRVVMIVNEELGRIIVPKICELQQIISIYVHCQEKKASDQWAQQFAKVKLVTTRWHKLIHQIQSDQSQRQLSKQDESLSINIFNTNVQDADLASTGLNGKFIHSQLLIDCLIRMTPSSNDKRELIDFCKPLYKTNPSELKIMEDFECNYSSDRSVWWYTKESFLYRMLNKALRVQDVDTLYLFRFFIRDLQRQLEKNKCSSHVHVYRAQQMSKDEIKILKKCVGEYISMNSFLSTSLIQKTARSFFSFANRSDDLELVFFKIDADSRLNSTKPFSNISKLAESPKEEEVLFMIGSIFRLDEVKRGDDGIWNIHMEFCSYNDNKLQSLYQYMKVELGTGETDLLILGHVLRDIGKLDDAEKYYHRYRQQMSQDDPNLFAYYHAVGRVTNAKGDYASSLNWYHESLDILMRTQESDHPNIATTHNSIATAHCKMGNNAGALESYEKALPIWKKEHGENHQMIATCLNNMGAVYQNEKNYSKALEFYQKALDSRERYLPSDHSLLGSSNNNIGNIYLCLRDYDRALKHLDRSLKIFEKALPPEHSDIATTLDNIGIGFECKGDFRQALSYFEKAAKIYRRAFPLTHHNVIQIRQSIDRVSSKV